MLDNCLKFMCTEFGYFMMNVNLWWMVMQIWMMKWNHKMAPRWRHGWMIRLRRLLYPFLIRAKILWEFEDDCSFRFWDIFNTKFIQKSIKKRDRYVLFIDADVIPLQKFGLWILWNDILNWKFDHVPDIWLKIWDHITDSP